MTPERFRALLDAHGADFQRWPVAERADAEALARDTPALRALQVDAAGLDGWLDSHAVAGASPALLARIAAGAPRGKLRGVPSWLWPGAGLAGVGLAGSLAGALAVSVALRAAPSATPDWVERGTAFGELSADWSEE
jgi:hypothetical protein